MAELVRVDGSTLTPNLSGFHEGIRAAAGALRDDKKFQAQQEQLARQNQLDERKQNAIEAKAQYDQQQAQQKQARINQLLPTIMAPQDPNNPQGKLLSQEAIVQLYATDPDLATKVQQQQKIRDDSHRQELGSALGTALKTPYQERANVIANLPIDDQNKKKLLAMDDVQQQNTLAVYQHSLLPVDKQIELGTPKKTNTQLDLEAAGLVPGTPEYKAELLRRTEKSPLVQMVGEKEEEKGIAKARTKQYEELQSRGAAAVTTADSVQTLRAIDPQTGATAPIKTKLAAIADGFGLKGVSKSIGDAPAGQSVTGIANKLVLSVLATQKGAQTEGDRDTVKTTIGQLGDTKEAYNFKLNYLDSVSKRDMEEQSFVEDKLAQGENLATANKAWREYRNKTPLVSQKLKQSGLPVFFYQFKENARAKRPDITDDQVLEAWRQANGVRE